MPKDDVQDAHVLVPESIEPELPRLYTAERQEDPIARLKFFTPDSSFTWFLVEYSPEERLAFGLVIGHERELGYFSIAELEEVRGPMGLRVERDLYFDPEAVSQCT